MPDYKALLQEMIEQVWNPAREPAVDRYYAADFRSHDPDEPAVTGREDLRQAVLGISAAFPDFQVTITDMIAEGDRVAKRFVFSGTHRGEYGGLPATGRHLEATGVCVYRFEGDKVAECWWNRDALGMMRQLGLELAPAVSTPA